MDALQGCGFARVSFETGPARNSLRACLSGQTLFSDFTERAHFGRHR